jgi:glycosyltransferase involved in cell wall biosynthesis
MKLSVCIITYNHEKYIAQCIESALFQIVDFDFEIVIGIDKSSDNTLAICKSYQSKFPNLIRLIECKENIGMIKNWINTIKSCKGDFIAICEGDDYWIDPYKLKKQVHFLINNNKYVGCFHNTEERYESGGKPSLLYCDFNNSQAISLVELSRYNPIPTCSVVFLNKYIQNLPDWYFEMKVADWPLHLINAQHGNFWYIPHVMGVHRLSLSSSWSLQSKERNSKVVIEEYEKMIIGFHRNIYLSNLLKKGKIRFQVYMRFPILNYLEYIYYKSLKLFNGK